MKKVYGTMTYGTGFPLKIEANSTNVFPRGVEVKAEVDLETGKVDFFLDETALAKLKRLEQK
ncbi:hypothetical protein ACNAN0_02655 [Agrilactobacillus fermenti]|uniref:hypothetical protein n=1 Tax=Agrilactobacillus fermenti TaxID=2586909 RepID=UPI001E43B26C|nr:hypothetical protein [Agrilactobacillus fermenti]MCD2256383.1 hypothetical protein [Agrilactobacillus fermenti]